MSEKVLPTDMHVYTRFAGLYTKMLVRTRGGYNQSLQINLGYQYFPLARTNLLKACIPCSLPLSSARCGSSLSQGQGGHGCCVGPPDPTNELTSLPRLP